MEFIHQRPEWPNITWSYDALAGPLAEVRYHQGLLLGRMLHLGFDLRSEAALTTVTSEIITSSAIEGESLDPEQVRSSVARHLGLETGGQVAVGRDVEGIVEMMTDATRHYCEPLTTESLEHVLYKARVRRAMSRWPVHARQKEIVERMMDNFEGYMHTSKYARMAQCSSDTALRDINQLVEHGIFIRNPGGGRSTSYRLATGDELTDAKG